MKLEQTDLEVFRLMIKQTITDYFNKKENKEFEHRLFTIKEVIKMTHKSYGYIRGLIDKGTLKTTKDGKFISGKAINDFLQIIK